MKLTFVDGTSSPLFGHRQPNVEDVVRIDPQTQMPAHISAVRIQAWGENYVQALTLLGGQSHSEELAKLTCSKGKGDTRTYEVDPGDRVVGVYGYQDSKGDIRGFGFLVS